MKALYKISSVRLGTYLIEAIEAYDAMDEACKLAGYDSYIHYCESHGIVDTDLDLLYIGEA